MNTKARRSLQSMKAHSNFGKDKVEVQSSFTMDPHKPTTSRRGSIRERKMALQQDVDKLKKRLRHEENVHRALERAFTRPPGTLPRLPPYLPPQTLELVAEVAVLEEEVVRLEEKVVHFRQGLYQEAVYISSSKKNMENFTDLCDTSQIKDPKPRQSASSLNILKKLPSFSDERRRKENQSSTNSSKNKQLSPNSVLEPIEKHPVTSRPVERRLDPHRLRMERQVTDHDSSEGKSLANQDEISTMDDDPNNISESILKCLMNIFVKMSSKKNRRSDQNLPSVQELSVSERLCAQCNDPYNLFPRFGVREIGPYKHLISIGDTSIDPDRTTISIFLVQRLKVLFQRLATVNLKGLSHQERLAFWINIYNSCMMNAFIEYGIPESPERIVELMQMAKVNVGGQILNAITIEHFILRLPYHSKYTFSKGTEHSEKMTRNLFGLELSEPLVTFALSCGSWSSPAVRVYTATKVEEELETAKAEYLQAAVGISSVQKCIALPKLMDWYLLDFAKDLESLLDWICLQLPPELGKEAMRCLESRKDETFLQCLQIMPYEFRFRYLLQT